MGLFKGRDKLWNGATLGGILGALLVWGDTVYDWLVGVIPSTWQTFAGDWSLALIFIGGGALVGYLVDRF